MAYLDTQNISIKYNFCKKYQVMCWPGGLKDILCILSHVTNSSMWWGVEKC